MAMIACKFCGKQYDSWRTQAEDFQRFCSPWCEARTFLPFPTPIESKADEVSRCRSPLQPRSISTSS